MKYKIIINRHNWIIDHILTIENYLNSLSIR